MTSNMPRRGVSVGITVVLSAACATHAPPRGRLDVRAVARDVLEVYIGKIQKLSAAPVGEPR